MIRNKISEQEILPAAYLQALHCSYRVWMLTPQESGARLIEYEMDQEAIEELLEDYTRFADMVVRIEVSEGAGGASAVAAVDVVSE